MWSLNLVWISFYQIKYFFLSNELWFIWPWTTSKADSPLFKNRPVAPMIQSDNWTKPLFSDSLSELHGSYHKMALMKDLWFFFFNILSWSIVAPSNSNQVNGTIIQREVSPLMTPSFQPYDQGRCLKALSVDNIKGF